MIDQRFSSKEFASRGLDSEDARELAASLAEEIQNDLHQLVNQRLLKIVEQLNAMGHNLKPEYTPLPGDISYRDEWSDGGGYHCRLRLGVDIIVSCGYAHLLTTEEALSANDEGKSIEGI